MHATISDVICDTVQNSIEAGAKKIRLTISEDGGMIRVDIGDDGKGMDEATQARVWDPFYTEPGKHDKRRVGLGLPLLRQIAESTGGSVSLKSRKGVGTELSYSFAAGNVDTPPMGDLAGTLLSLFNYDGAFDLAYTHTRGGESWSVSRSELLEAVGSLQDAQGLSLAARFLREQEEALGRPAGFTAAI